MTCTFATESTDHGLVNTYPHCLVQEIGVTAGLTYGSIKLGLEDCTSKTFRLALFAYTSSSETGSKVAYMESDAISASSEVVQFNLDTPYTVPSGVTKLYIIVTASPDANYDSMRLYTPGVSNSGYSYTVTYSNIEARTAGFTFLGNETLLHAGICEGSPSGGATLLLPPPIAWI